MRLLITALALPSFIALCLLALQANADAAHAGRYAGADQFLYSLAGR